MIIKPQKSDTILWVCTFIGMFVFLFLIVNYPSFYPVDKLLLAYATSFILCVTTVIGYFFFAFSVYELSADGIQQTCLFYKRYFKWNEFKFIGIQLSSTYLDNGSDYLIRCSTVALPKSMTPDKFRYKHDWPLSKTITIPCPYKEEDMDQLICEFFSYCGGERDIRE